MNAPRVSVVVVNFRGADDTIACLDSLRELDWPDDALEVIVVENGSGDDSADRIRGAHPDRSLVQSDVNLGFAGGCNLGSAKATGDYLAFLNNDARPEPGWIREAVAVLRGKERVACVASKVLDWDGSSVDFVDAGLTFYGHGFKLHVGDPDSDAFDRAHDVLFATGTAMVIEASIFREAGGFDARYFMFFEDVDLGWRLWLLGHRVRYVPTSLVYHKHHASMRGVAPWREHYLLERNALFTIYKNYDNENLGRFLPAAMALAVRRGVALGGDDAHTLDLACAAPPEEPERIEMHRHAAAAAYAVDALVENLAGLGVDRRRIQAQRRRTDAEVFRLFRLPIHANVNIPSFVAGFDTVVREMGLDVPFSERRRILVVTADTLRPAMAGPAIRAWQIACALSREHEVELASTTECRDLSHPDFAVREVTSDELRELVDWCDVCVFQGHVLHENQHLRTSSKVIVVDIYDPFHLEQLEQARDFDEDQRRGVVRGSTEVLNEQLARGDFFTCASEKQRDFWLGQLSAVGRINPVTYDQDETLRELIAVVPFGVDDAAPRHTRPVLKGVVAGIAPDDKVVLWGGGIYNWFDPLTLLRSVDKLRVRVPSVRVFFMGLKHPNPNVPEMRMAVETRRLADQLGLTGRHAFFNEGWVEYADRQNYLLEADLGVSTHLDHVETEFSFRTRILDYLWASLPMVITQGDALAELVERHGLGTTVPAEDVDALEEALFVMLSDDERRSACRSRMPAVAEEYRWSKVLTPLLEFCRGARRAPDLLDPEMTTLMAYGAHGRAERWLWSIRRLERDLRDHRYRVVLRKLLERLRRAAAPTRS